MKIGSYQFAGPLEAPDDLRDEPGLCAVVHVGETGTCVLVLVKYAENVRTTVALLTADPAWQERVRDGDMKYGVRYTGDYSEDDLKQTLIDLESQYLVTCLL